MSGIDAVMRRVPDGGYKGPEASSPMWEHHYRYIEWQGRDWLRLRDEFPNHPLITGGDYNQNRDGTRWYGTRWYGTRWYGTRWYGTRKGRDLLSEALSLARLRCVTELDFVAASKLEKRHTVDVPRIRGGAAESHGEIHEQPGSLRSWLRTLRGLRKFPTKRRVPDSRDMSCRKK